MPSWWECQPCRSVHAQPRSTYRRLTRDLRTRDLSGQGQAIPAHCLGGEIAQACPLSCEPLIELFQFDDEAFQDEEPVNHGCHRAAGCRCRLLIRWMAPATGIATCQIAVIMVRRESGVGYKQTSSRPKSTSALPPRADIRGGMSAFPSRACSTPSGARAPSRCGRRPC